MIMQEFTAWFYSVNVRDKEWRQFLRSGDQGILIFA